MTVYFSFCYFVFRKTSLLTVFKVIYEWLLCFYSPRTPWLVYFILLLSKYLELFLTWTFYLGIIYASVFPGLLFHVTFWQSFQKDFLSVCAQYGLLFPCRFFFFLLPLFRLIFPLCYIEGKVLVIKGDLKIKWTIKGTWPSPFQSENWGQQILCRCIENATGELCSYTSD